MPLSVRARFEVFKRDDFTCRYCGRKTPDVVLEADHIVPVCEGGSDDPINLATSCWECNRGKAGNPLDAVVTSEDPHDRAVMMLERARQLREYDTVLSALLNERIATADYLMEVWCEETGREGLLKNQWQWIVNTLERVPAVEIKKAIMVAAAQGKTSDLRYVQAIIRNRRAEGTLTEVA